MAKGADRFLSRAADHGLHLEVATFPEGTRTAQDAARAIGCEVAAIVKSLVFLADDTPVLVLTSGANRVDESLLAATLGAEVVRKADAGEVREATGYAIGGTPPFGLEQQIRVLCDNDLLRFDRVWAAAGTPTQVFGIAPDTLIATSGAEVAAVTG